MSDRPDDRLDDNERPSDEKLDWALAIEVYFDRLDDKQVAPVRYRDASTYERLRETWADDRPLPTEKQLRTHWRTTGEAVADVHRASKLTIEERLARIEAQLNIT